MSSKQGHFNQVYSPQFPNKSKSTPLCYLIVTWKVCIVTVILLGFIWQTILISSKYFQYQTVTQLTISRPDYIVPPAVTLCIDYPDLLNRSMFHHLPEFEGIANNKSSFSTGLTSVYLTIKDIFKMTPNVSDLFNHQRINTSCIYHLPHKYYLATEGDCQARFSFRKHYKGRQICYSIEFHHESRFTLRHLSTTLEHSQSYYRITLDSKNFANSSLMHIKMHTSGTLARGASDKFALIERGLQTRDKTAKYGYFYLTYSRLVTIRLKAPYTTNCHNYRMNSFESRAHCYERCLSNLTVHEFNRVPFTGVTELPLAINHIGTHDIENGTFAEKLLSFENHCSELCSRPDCYEEIYLPKLSSSHQLKNGIKLRLTVPDEPDIIAVAQPQITTIDYVTYIISCLSFWTAFSPTQFYHIWNKKVEQPRKNRRN